MFDSFPEKMENYTQKKKRSVNFTHNEHQILVSLVIKYIHVVENKTTNAITWRQKAQTWDKITHEFNSETPEYIKRDSKTIKSKYETIKRSIKMKNTRNKSEPLLDFEERLLTYILPYMDFQDCGRNISFNSDNVGEGDYEGIAEEYPDDMPEIVPEVLMVAPDVNVEIEPKINVKNFSELTEATDINTIQKNTIQKNTSHKNAIPKNTIQNRRIVKTNTIRSMYQHIAKRRKRLIEIKLKNAMIENRILKKQEEDLEEELNFKKKERKLTLLKLKMNIINSGEDEDLLST